MLSKEECSNSGGWFKDPFTEKDIDSDYPRAITCGPGDKWVQPAVMFENGDIVKISGRCWNDSERACYKEYRGKGSSKPKESKSQESKPKESKPKKSMYAEIPLDERKVIKYEGDATPSADSLAIIYMCDKLLGVTQISGLYYALLTVNGSNTIYHIPKQLIPEEQFERLCQNF